MRSAALWIAALSFAVTACGPGPGPARAGPPNDVIIRRPGDHEHQREQPVRQQLHQPQRRLRIRGGRHQDRGHRRVPAGQPDRWSGRDAIYLQTAAGWDISGNHLYGNAQGGINAVGLYGTTIADNYIEDFGARQPAGTWYGIAGTAQGGGVGSTIGGNKISNDLGEAPGASHVSIAITQAQGGTGYLSVTGNVIAGAGPGDVGFSFSAAPGQLVVASAGNQVSGVGTVRRSAAGVTLTSGS